MVHMADVHLDLYYVPGTDALCPESVLGCREECGIPSDESRKAKEIGSYGCDLPVPTF